MSTISNIKINNTNYGLPSGGGVPITLLAPAFSTSTYYKGGEYVSYNNKIYLFIYEKFAGAWDASKVKEITTVSKEFCIDMIAPEFSTSEAYSKGDFVTYNNKLYRFTSDKSAGQWSGGATEFVVGNTLGFCMDSIENIVADRCNFQLGNKIGDFIIYENKLYRMILDRDDHTAEPFDPEDEGVEIKILNVITGDYSEIIAKLQSEYGLAAFDPTASYVVGDIVSRHGYTFKCKSAYTGDPGYTDDQFDMMYFDFISPYAVFADLAYQAFHGGGGGSVDYTQLIAKLQSEYGVETFESGSYYDEGQYVVNNNKTYVCTTNYEGSGTFSNYFSEMSPEAVLADLAYKNINTRHPLIEMWQNSSFDTSDTYTHSFRRASRNWPPDLYKYRTLKFIYYEEEVSGNDTTIKNMAVLTMPNYIKTLSETSGDEKSLSTDKFMKCDVGSLNTQGTDTFTLALKDLIAADGEYIDLHISINGYFVSDGNEGVYPEIGVRGSFTRYKATCDASNNVTFTKYNPENMNMYLIFDDYSEYGN